MTRVKYQYRCVWLMMTLIGSVTSCAQHQERNTNDELTDIISKLMERHQIPGVSVAFLKDGKLNTTITSGVLQKGKSKQVNDQTFFSVGSISKVVNAALVLKLVDQGKLDLDTDVNQYLTSWKVSKSSYTKTQPVTIRKILSHTAGFSVHGFADYLPGEELPKTREILNGQFPAKNEPVKLIFDVGSQFKYSGGGITVLQMLVEDVMGLPYHEAANRVLFAPLNMKRSSFKNPLPESLGNIARAHNDEGNPVAKPRGYQSMPEKAASGLWTCPTDLAILMENILVSYFSEDSTFLSQSIASDMLSAEQNSQFGLGPKKGNKDGHEIFFHNGANDSYRANFTISLTNRSGYIIFTNGSNGLEFIDELKPIIEQIIW